VFHLAREPSWLPVSAHSCEDVAKYVAVQDSPPPSLWIICWISRCPCGDALCWCPCLIAGFYHPLRFKAVSNWSLVSGGVIWDGCLIGQTGRRDDMSMYASTFRHCLLTHLCVACSFIVFCTITSHATWRSAHHSRCNCSSSTSPSRLSTVHWICFPQLT